MYPLNSQTFLSLKTLKKLSGQTNRIRVLKVEVMEWHQSLINQAQIYTDRFLDAQGFDQINLTFPCHYQQTKSQRVQWVLSRYLHQQDPSPCPTQLTLKSQISLNSSNVYPPRYSSSGKDSSSSTSKGSILFSSFIRSTWFFVCHLHLHLHSIEINHFSSHF